MSAIISDCGKYRYRLERHGLSGAGAIAWIGVNPASADAVKNDNSVTKMVGFSERAGTGWPILGNKFAYRDKDVTGLRRPVDPVGPDNDRHLRAIMAEASIVVAAWGPLSKLPPTLRRRWYKVVRIADEVGCRLMCLGTAQDGQPRHPLMVPYAPAPRSLGSTMTCTSSPNSGSSARVCWPWALRSLDPDLGSHHPAGGICRYCRCDVATVQGSVGAVVCIYCALDRGLTPAEDMPLHERAPATPSALGLDGVG